VENILGDLINDPTTTKILATGGSSYSSSDQQPQFPGSGGRIIVSTSDYNQLLFDASGGAPESNSSY
jgi:hypothetical protein